MYMDKISRSFDFNFRRYRALGRYLLIQSKGIKAHIASVVAIGSLAIATNAQPSVSWQTPVSISGTSDVKTSGVYFGSWAPQDGSANTYPVNGVTFQGFSDLPGFTPGPIARNGIKAVASLSSQLIRITPEWVLAKLMIDGSSRESHVSPARMVFESGHPDCPCMSLHWFGVMKV